MEPVYCYCQQVRGLLAKGPEVPWYWMLQSLAWLHTARICCSTIYCTLDQARVDAVHRCPLAT